ncbi:MAG: hypothetical protein MJZ11_06945 [Lachnospiraceae bacterium]|nr:hypothetical protein [Lachnospiraceae bacterium]
MIKKIRRLEVNKIEIIGSVLLAFAFLSFFTMMGAWTIHLNSGLSRHWYDFALVFFLFCICSSDYCFIVTDNISIMVQKSILHFSVSLLIGLASARKDIFDQYPQGGYWYSLIIISSTFLLSSLINVHNYRKVTHNSVKKNLNNIINSIQESKGILVVLLGFLIIRTVIGIIQPRWDGSLLYKFMLNIHSDEIFSFYSTSAFGHISQAYCGINAFLDIIFGDTLLGMTVGNLIFFLLGVFSTYRLIKTLFVEKSMFVHIVFTLMYATSPLMLGMIGYNFYDQWAFYLMPIVSYTLLSREWIFHFFFATVMCFTKETAFVQYFGLCLGTLVAEKGIEKKKWTTLLQEKKWYGMLLIGLVWLFIYMYLPNWGGNGDFIINVNYIVSKLKVFYILDFLWIYFALFIVALVLCTKKSKRPNTILYTIAISDITFVIFSCSFETVNHARYMGGHLFCLIILGIYGLSFLEKKYVYLVGSLIVFLQMISCFMTIDPLTKMLFTNYNVGNNVMISTDDEFFSDTMVYNFQYTYFDKALNLAIKEIVDDKEDVIFFPQIKKDWSWYFDGNYVDAYNIAKDGVIVTEYWDRKNAKRVIIPNENSSLLRVCNISSYEKMLETNIDNGYYFYVSELDNGIYDELMKNDCVIDNQAFSFGGFTVNRAKIVLNR